MVRLTFKIFRILLVGIVVIGMFVIKNEVISLERELDEINEQIIEDQKEIHVLKAEWTHLNDPERLRTLSERYAKLRPLRGEQIISFSAIPLKAVQHKKQNESGIIRLSYAPSGKRE